MELSTSPSLYLEVVGTAAVSDQCGGVGGTLTNPYIAIPPGSLSTMSLPSYLYSIGGDYVDPSRNLGVNMGIFKPLNVADLECPTFGLGLATGTDGTVRTTVGPPYLPIIIPPPQALTLDPDWQKQCTSYQTALEGAPGFSFAIFDPPRALTAAGALTPSDPPDVPAMPTKSTPAAADPTLQPQQIPTLDGPKPTSTSDPSSNGSNDPPGDPQTPSPPENQGGETVGGSNSGNQGADTPNQGSQPGVVPNQGDQGGGGSSQGNQGGDGSSQGDQHGDQNPQPDPDKQGENEVNPGSAAPNKDSPQNDAPATSEENPQLGNGLGGLIIGGLNGGPPQPGNSPDPTPADPATLTVGGQVITANPSNVIVAGSTLNPGGNDITVSGTSLSLGNDGNLVVNGNSIPIPYAPLHVSPAVLTVGGQTFTALPNGFAVAGSSVVPGGSPVVVSGTPIALGSSGILTVGSSSILLPSGAVARPVFTLGALTFTESSSNVLIDGKTLSADGPVATVAGAPLSLASDGRLVVGSLTTNLPLNVNNGAVFTVGGLVFTEGSSSDLVVDGKTVLPGGSPINIAGAPVSLASDGRLAVGALTTNLPLSMNNGAVFTAGGLSFTEGSSDLVVDGKKVFPGGSPITVAGTPVSLGSDGKLIVGSLTTNLPNSIGSSNGAIFTAGGLVFTEGSSDIVVDGTTVFPGRSSITVAGTPISLGSDGTLVVGSSTTTLPTNLGGGSSTPQFFEGAQGRNTVPSLMVLVGIYVMLVLCTQ